MYIMFTNATCLKQDTSINLDIDDGSMNDGFYVNNYH